MSDSDRGSYKSSLSRVGNVYSRFPGNSQPLEQRLEKYIFICDKCYKCNMHKVA